MGIDGVCLRCWKQSCLPVRGDEAGLVGNMATSIDMVTPKGPTTEHVALLRGNQHLSRAF